MCREGHWTLAHSPPWYQQCYVSLTRTQPLPAHPRRLLPGVIQSSVQSTDTLQMTGVDLINRPTGGHSINARVCGSPFSYNIARNEHLLQHLTLDLGSADAQVKLSTEGHWTVTHVTRPCECTSLSPQHLSNIIPTNHVSSIFS